MNSVENNFWIEKYRPNTLDDLVVDNRLKENIKKYINSLQNNTIKKHLLIWGPAGTGKTSLVKLIINAIKNKYTIIEINASLNFFENIIDLYNNAKNNTENRRIIIIDEFDKLQLIQQNKIIELMKNTETIFILVFNLLNKSLEKIKAVSDIFVIKAYLKIDDIKSFLENILKKENVKYDNNILQTILNLTVPNIRRCINETNKLALEFNKEININNLQKSEKAFLEEKFTELFLNLVQEKNQPKTFENEIVKKLYSYIYSEKIDYLFVLELINLKTDNIFIKTYSAKMFNEMYSVLSQKMAMIEFLGTVLSKI